MSVPDPLDALLGKAAQSTPKPESSAPDLQDLAAYTEHRADPETVRRVEGELAKSPAQRQLWRAMQDQDRPHPRISRWWMVPAIAAAAALVLTISQPVDVPNLQVGPLPPGLSNVRGTALPGLPRYGPEHHPEVDLRSESEAPMKVHLYTVNAQGRLARVRFDLVRRSAWVHTLSFSALEASGGRAGPVQLVFGPASEDWTGEPRRRGLAQLVFEFVPQ